MRIIVVIGRVLDPAGIVVNRRAGRIFVNREEYILQPADRCALEAALRVKDAAGAEVIALPRSLLPDDDVLRQALARGADRAIHLVGQVGNLPYEDAAMTRVLAAAVQRLGGADLILTGATTLDTGQSQLGPRLAEALGWPQILGAWQVTIQRVSESAKWMMQAVVMAQRATLKDVILSDRRERRISWLHERETLRCAQGDIFGAVRRDGAGYVTVEADLPAVVTVAPGALKLRYPDGVRLINVYRAGDAVERWEVSDLVDEAALRPQLEKRGQEFPPERERGVRLSGTPEEMAQALAETLRQRMRR
ncbi:MAG: hypothetical protein QHJ81_03820 [Anaerolineae bacterium]|nr:hypothetical protein [Anaerolineae bacterium]